MSLLSDLVEGTAGWRSSLDAVVGPQVDAAAQAWTQAGQEARDHILLVMENSPGRSQEEILGRWDVQQAIKTVFQEAKATAREHVSEAWVAGRSSGRDHANEQLDALGLRPVDRQSVPDTVLSGVLRDLDRNADIAEARFAGVTLYEPRGDIEQELTKITQEMARRASYAAQTAGYTAHSLAQERAYAEAQARSGKRIGKMWVTRFGPGTCPHCAALHGTVVPLGQPFTPVTFHPRWKIPKPYLGRLWGPPLHPNCRCRLVPFVSKMEPERQTLTEAAWQWWVKVARRLGLGR